MYEKQLAEAKFNTIAVFHENPTVEENLDRRIAHLRAELERIEQSKADLGPLLKMRIRDVRNAMEMF